MRIAIVNDLPLAVEALRRALARAPGHEVAWVAWDGREAVTKCVADKPDLILMDLIMPNLDGVEATRQIMGRCPCAILVVTVSVDGNISKVFEAMGSGALDAVNTPVLGRPGGEVPLLEKIERIGRLLGKPSSRTQVMAPRPARALAGAPHPFLIAIGASTGGPRAVADVLAQWPAECDAATVIIQHVDQHFAAGLAHWLRQQCGRPVELAQEGARLRPGDVVLAGKDDHLIVAADLSLRYTVEPRECPYRPSVDEFFRSAATWWPSPGAAALLTGMGRDGAQGLLALRRANWATVAEAQETCIIYGMPRAAAELGAAEAVLPLSRIGNALVEKWRRARTGGAT